MRQHARTVMPPAAPTLELRHNCVTLVENFAQTLGALSPVGTIGVIIPLIIATAGNGTWVLLLVILSVFSAVLASILRFASMHSSAGSLSAFARLGFGPWGGLICGWIYVVGIFFCIPSAILASASYCDLLLLPYFGASGGERRAECIAVLLTVAMWMAAHRSVKLSTNLMLVIECSSLILVLSLLAAGMWHAHAWIDPAQMHLSKVNFPGMQGGVVLAFMLVAGFEGATSLGEEAKNPRSSIPRAILGCMLPLAALYILATYCITSLENKGVIAGTVNGLTVPFDDLARAISLPWLGKISSLGIALSYFACGLASLTIASRVLFAMSRDGQWWPSFGQSHVVNGTPHRAIALISLFSIAVFLAMMLGRTDFGVSFNFLTQLGSIGVVAAYLLIVVALPLHLHRRQTLAARDLAVAGIASLLLGLVLVLSVYPEPAPPFGYVSYVFFAAVAACLAVSMLRRSRSGAPEMLPGVNNS